MKLTKKTKIIGSVSICAVVVAVALTLGLYFGLREKPDTLPYIEPEQPLILNETDVDLVSDGKSAYKIVVPAGQTTKMLGFAQSELQLFFGEATGIALDAVTDDVLQDGDTKYISLGNTEQLAAHGWSGDYAELGRSGYRIKRDGESVFIFGASDYGTAFGVYEFLQHQFDYEYYYKDTYSLNTNVRNRKLLDFDLTTVPSIDQTYLAMGEVIEDETHAHRLRTYTQEDVFLGIGASRWHTAFAILGEMTEEQRALWVSSTGTQPCFSRDREGISTHMAENIMDGLRRDMTVTAVNIGQADNPNWCECDACTAELNKYDTNSATYIKTINLVADKVQAMLDEEQPGRKITITFFAYLATAEPPVKEKEGGGYEPIDEEVRLRPNVSVLNAQIAMNAYLHYPLTDAHNSGPKKAIEKWAALGTEQYMWIYNNTFYGNYFTPAESFNGTQETLQFLTETGTRWVMQQGQQNNTVSPDWSRLKAYLDAKLAWNVYADQQTLIQNFIKAYFGPAAEAMQTYFDDYRSWYVYIAEKLDYTEHRTMQPDYFPRNVLNSWLGSIDEAYAAIAPYKTTDPDRYDALYDRILLESLSPRYLQMAIFRTDFSEADQTAMEETFRKDCSNLGVMMLSEKKYIEGNALFS